LDIYRGEADLSRRVLTYLRAGLFSREILIFTKLKIILHSHHKEKPCHFMGLGGNILRNPLFTDSSGECQGWDH